MLLAWLVSFLLVKGTFEHASVGTGSFWRLLMPAWPAYLLLVAAIPLLLPVWGRALASRFSVVAGTLPRRRAVLVIAAVALALAPLPLIALTAQPAEASALTFPQEQTLVPVDARLGLSARRRGDRLVLTWDAPATAARRVFFRVYRAPAGAELDCPDPARANNCRLPEALETVETTRETRWEGPVPEGEWSYRVGLAANWRDDPALGDTLLLSRAVEP
jgi:hypothetical protein